MFHVLHKLKKDIVVGLGEIGKPILQLISKSTLAVGYDINKNLMNDKKFTQYSDVKTRFLHVCIPFSKSFIHTVVELYNRFNPEAIVIHSTISPGTTNKLQKKLTIPIIYSATRGVHRRMRYDLKRYTKFYAITKNIKNGPRVSHEYEKLMKNSGITTKRMSNPLTLELAKIVVDTSYYGWIINYAQLSNMIAIKNNIDYDEMWSFSDEIHKFLGNRPKMFPGFIGGHCVIPNLELIQNNELYLINKINNDYAKLLKSVK